MALSKLQIWLWSCSSCRFGAKRHMDTRSIPLARVSGKRRWIVADVIKRLDTSLKIMSPFFFNSSRRDFVHDPFSTSPTFCWFLSSVLRLLRWHLEVLLPLEDRFWILAFFQQVRQLFVNKWDRIPFQVPGTNWTWILCRCVPILSYNHIQFPETGWSAIGERLLLLLLRLPVAPWCHLWRRSRGWESFEVFDLSSEKLP